MHCDFVFCIFNYLKSIAKNLFIPQGNRTPNLLDFEAKKDQRGLRVTWRVPVECGKGFGFLMGKPYSLISERSLTNWGASPFVKKRIGEWSDFSLGKYSTF